jgi:hypothetical protein
MPQFNRGNIAGYRLGFRDEVKRGGWSRKNLRRIEGLAFGGTGRSEPWVLRLCHKLPKLLIPFIFCSSGCKFSRYAYIAMLQRSINGYNLCATRLFEI